MPFLELAAVFLLAAVILVPLFQRLKLGAVLGYVAAGMLIGPWGLRLAGNVEKTLDFGELGVALLLFLVGLELEPKRLWALRQRIFGLGGAQLGFTGIALTAVAVAVGVSWHAALVVGFGLAMSSTALVLASLDERNQAGSNHGRAALAVLLFQDIAVIALIALLPLLAYASLKDAVSWTVAARTLGTIIVFILVSHFAVRPALRLLARIPTREVFTAGALLLVIGSAVVMEHVGLSMSLGAFLAGLMLADSEFRHELESAIEPFKGLLLGLFFMAVGMSANLGLLAESPLRLLAIAAAFMAIKFAVVYAVTRLSAWPPYDGQRLAVALAQGGEFAFVLFAAAAGLKVIDKPLQDTLVMAVTISMIVASPLMRLHDSLLARWIERKAEPEYDTIDGPANPVIVAGFGRFGQIVARVLRMCDIPFTALEASSAQVDFVRRFGNRIYYGDASRLELLRAAKTGDAKLFVLAIDDVEASVRTAALVRRHFPRLEILARARNRVHYFRLKDVGVNMVFRETFPASLELAHYALLKLGFGVAASQRAVSVFKQHDEQQLEVQYAVHRDEEEYMQSTLRAAEQLRELFEADVARQTKGFLQPAPKRE